MILELPELEPEIDVVKEIYNRHGIHQKRWSFRSVTYTYATEFQNTEERILLENKTDSLESWARNLINDDIHDIHPVYIITKRRSGIPAHVDNDGRLAAINLPISGHWDKSTLRTHDEDGNVSEEHHFGLPVFINTSTLHSVDNRRSDEPRIVASLGFFSNTFEELIDLHKKNLLFKEWLYEKHPD